jgi:hypothetical protein
MGTIYRVHEENSRLQYYTNTLDYYTLNTPAPSQMQRECNDVAFEESTKHTQLKQNKYIQSRKSKMSSKPATLECR